MTRRGRRVLWIGLLLALGGIGIRLVGSDSVRWLWTERVFIRTSLGGDPDPEVLGWRVQGWREYDRWGEQLEKSYQVWSTDSGMLRMQGVGHYSTEALTAWNEDGTIRYQVAGASWQHAPPWKWGKTDQSVPSAPWILEGVTADEWWDALPERVKEE